MAETEPRYRCWAPPPSSEVSGDDCYDCDRRWIDRSIDCRSPFPPPPGLGGGGAPGALARAFASHGIAAKQPRQQRAENHYGAVATAAAADDDDDDDDDNNNPLHLDPEKKRVKMEDEEEVPEVDEEMYGNERSGVEKAEAEKEEDQGNLYGIDLAGARIESGQKRRERSETKNESCLP